MAWPRRGEIASWKSPQGERAPVVFVHVRDLILLQTDQWESLVAMDGWIGSRRHYRCRPRLLMEASGAPTALLEVEGHAPDASPA